MPSQQEVKWSQLKVGLIVLVSLFLLSGLLFLMTSASGMSLFSHKIAVHSYFENSAGLKPGAPVGLDGVTIGEVTKVTVSTAPDRKLTPVLVEMKLDPKYKASLHADTTATLSTVGVLGDTVVDLDSKTAKGPELQSGDELRTLESPSLTDIVKASQGTVDKLNTILTKMDTIVDGVQMGQGTVGKLIKDPDLYNRADRTIDQLQTLVANLNAGKGSAGKLLTDDQLYNQLRDTTAKLDDIAAKLDAGKGSAGKLLTDDQLYNNLNSTLAHANSLLAEADSGKGALGLLTKNPAFAKKLNDTVANLDTLLNNVNTGKGTLGKLATDDAAYKHFDQLLVSSDDLIAAIKKDPKKYLEIHLRIF
jgi:phospholipid/cholesterol/gamma-HCH transport system substrate-binding protein